MMNSLKTLIMLLVIDATAGFTMAQDPAKLPNTDNGVLQWVVTAGVLVAVLGAALMNPKRSHLS